MKRRKDNNNLKKKVYIYKPGKVIINYKEKATLIIKSDIMLSNEQINEIFDIAKSNLIDMFYGYEYIMPRSIAKKIGNPIRVVGFYCKFKKVIIRLKTNI